MILIFINPLIIVIIVSGMALPLLYQHKSDKKEI